MWGLGQEDVGIDAVAVRIRCRDSMHRDVVFGIKFDIDKGSGFLRIHRLGFDKAVEMLRKCAGVEIDVEPVWG